MVGKTYDAGKNSPSQRADRIGPDTDPWKAFVKPGKVKDAPLQTVVHRSLCQVVQESNGKIIFSDLNNKEEISRSRYGGIKNKNSRPKPDAVQSLLQKLPTEKQDELRKYTDEDYLKGYRKTLIEKAMENFPLPDGKGEQERDKRLSASCKKWGISSPEFKNRICTGVRCCDFIALKVLFALGCTPDLGTKILAAYGFCWQDNSAAKFLQEKLDENRKKMGYGKNYCLSYLLSDWPKWQAMKNQFVA